MNYQIGTDGRLWEWHRNDMQLSDFEWTFNTKQRVVNEYALTIEGCIFDIKMRRGVATDQPFTSITSVNYLICGCTTSRQLVLIRHDRPIYSINYAVSEFIVDDIDYVIDMHMTIQGDVCCLAIRRDQWLRIDLIKRKIIHTYSNMPTLDQIIINRGDVIVTQGGVYYSSNNNLPINLAYLPDNIIDAISIFYEGVRDVIAAMNSEGEMYTCYHLSDMYESLNDNDGIFDILNRNSKWCGFVCPSDKDSRGRKMFVIYNERKKCYVVNNNWMIGEIEIPIQFLTKPIMSKNARSNIDHW